MDSDNFLPDVKQQYEELPYPPRDPERERHRLIQRMGDNLIVLNHHCFGGARDFRADFRALVAGGGTGDSTIYLAEQLRGLGGRVVHIDLSTASMAIARERARIRGLANIDWVNASIMDIPRLGLGQFDYINCTGVLHHLASSEAGLRLLADALKEGGAILLMLYGKYGRRAVYDMQELLRAYVPRDAAIAEKIRLARELLAALPPTNSFVRDMDTWRREISDDGFGDPGLYDLLLHSQDRCFTVPEIYALADSARLQLLGFIDRADAYDPLTILNDKAQTARLESLGLPARQAIAELMRSDIASHEFYLGKPGANKTATLADERNSLVLMGAMHGHHRQIANGLTPGRSLTFTGRSGSVTVVGNAINRHLFANMDGRTPLERVYKRTQKALPGVSRSAIQAELNALYKILHPHAHLYLLRQGSYGVKVPDYGSMQPA